MCWAGKYEMVAPSSLSNAPHFLEFTVRGTHPGRQFSASITFVNEKGDHLCTTSLVEKLSLGLESKSFSFDLSVVKFHYHNDKGKDYDVKIDPEMGVQLLGKDLLPSVVLMGHKWGPPSAGNPRWGHLRENGNFAWKGRYEMIPVMEDGEIPWDEIAAKAKAAGISMKEAAMDMGVAAREKIEAIPWDDISKKAQETSIT